MEQQQHGAGGDRRVVGAAAADAAVVQHPALGRGVVGGEGSQVDADQLQALWRQAQVQTSRGAEGGHAPRAHSQDH